MNELLKKLLEDANLLTEETRQEITEAFEQHLQEAADAVRAEVTAELNEQWIQERETLIEAIDIQVGDALQEELAELHAEFDKFRDLEVEYAERLAEAKADLADELNNDISNLIEALDTFVEIRLVSEMEELKADIEAAKHNKFGRQVFEAFVSEFRKHYVADDSIESKLVETEARLDDALTALEEAERVNAKLERDREMARVLSPLQGKNREVMEAILKHVDTSMLQEAYGTYIGKVLKESENFREGKQVLAEDVSPAKPAGVVKTGNDDNLIQERLEQGKFDKPIVLGESLDTLARLRRLGGVTQY